MKGESALSNDLLALALESLDRAPAVMAWLDRSLDIVWVNAAWRRFAESNGGTAATVVGVGLSYPDHCPAEVGQALGEIAAGVRDTLRFEYACHSPDQLRWVTFEARRLREGILVLHVDRTAEHLLRARTDLQEQVSQDLAARLSLGELGERIVACAGTHLGWEGGRVWLVEDGRARVGSTWVAPGVERAGLGMVSEAVLAHVEAARSARVPSQVADLDGDGLDLPVGFFVPLHDQGEVLLVIELRSHSSRPIDLDTARHLDAIGRQICASARAERMRERAAQAERLAAVGTLAAGVAHELNTPIQYVTNSLHFLKDAAHDVAGVVRAMRQLATTWDAAGETRPELAAALAQLRQAEEAADLDYLASEVPRAIARCGEGMGKVQEVVQVLQRFAPGPGSERRSPADLVPAIEDALALARHEVRPVADLELDLQVLPPVTCLLGEVRQAIMNLIVNAAQAVAERVARTGGRGRIGVRTWTEEARVVIAVSDDGDGIPEDIRSRIFEPFFTTRPLGAGLGQGLAHAWSAIVERHGGELGFVTELGVGTTFFVRLPR